MCCTSYLLYIIRSVRLIYIIRTVHHIYIVRAVHFIYIIRAVHLIYIIRTSYVLYIVYDVHHTCCASYMMYIIRAVHHTCCTSYVLYIVCAAFDMRYGVCHKCVRYTALVLSEPPSRRDLTGTGWGGRTAHRLSQIPLLSHAVAV